jgi:hypothetical protein
MEAMLFGEKTLKLSRQLWDLWDKCNGPGFSDLIIKFCTARYLHSVTPKLFCRAKTQQLSCGLCSTIFSGDLGCAQDVRNSIRTPPKNPLKSVLLYNLNILI